MTQKSGIWRFSGVLRAIALVLAGLYGLVALVIWGSVLFGNSKIIFDLVDIDSAAPLEPWQLILGASFVSIYVCGFIILCLAANKFLKTAKQDGFFMEEVIMACRRLGYGLLVFWLGLVLGEGFLRGVLTFNFPEDERVPLEWSYFLDQYVLILISLILLLIAKAMKEAREIDADNKQII